MTDRSVGPGSFNIDLPQGWVHATGVGPYALVARPETGEWHLTPSIDVVDDAPEAATAGLSVYVDTILSGTSGHVAGWRLLAMSSSEDGSSEAGSLDVLFAGVVDGIRATFRQHHRLSSDGRALVMTATVADVDWIVIGPEVTASIASLRVEP